MTFSEIPQSRLRYQQIAAANRGTAAEVVAALGAMQAQDYLGALWAIGLRARSCTERQVEQALADRAIVRTWPMRGTLHFVAAGDVRWMLELLGAQNIARQARRFQELELDSTVFVRCRKLFMRALRTNRQLPRNEMMALLERDGISTRGQRGIHILWRLAQEGVICFGARIGKQQTFALLDEWAPKGRNLSGAAALAELARRYFASHGPATLRDFTGWTGLKISDATAGLESVASELVRERIMGVEYWRPRQSRDRSKTARVAYLLPGFDEYLIGYKDRGAVVESRHAGKVYSGSNGMFLPTIVIDGRIVGTWRRTLEKKRVVITVRPFARFKKAEKDACAVAAQRYAEFIGLPASVRF